ncbi:MAG: class I mannose-6-phosphate isomerase [Clostridiaceae bacterium]|nr:class I mannose-6-phosphate isomerase [Clostridiaceae bacterium]
MFYPLKFEPVYKDYLWGGRNLSKFGKQLPEGKVAESWELSCHPDGMSVVKNGLFKGRTLQALLDEYGKEITGQDRIAVFPLLIKLIDANDKLSVQVHPDDDYARRHEGGQGKNEMWYIIDAKPDACLILDLKPGVTRKVFEKAVQEKRVEDCLQKVPVKKGDFINIPAGLVHAIGEGIVLAEVQQNSNITYRIYDYNRTDAFGNTRPLHLDKAMEVINFNGQRQAVQGDGVPYDLSGNGTAMVLVKNDYFCVELFRANGNIEQATLNRQFHIYICLEGEGTIQWGRDSMQFHMGETFMVPSSLGDYTLSGAFNALRAYVPENIP